MLIQPQSNHAGVAETVKPFLYQPFGRVGKRMDMKVKLSSLTPWLVIIVMCEQSGDAVYPLFCYRHMLISKRNSKVRKDFVRTNSHVKFQPELLECSHKTE